MGTKEMYMQKNDYQVGKTCFTSLLGNISLKQLAKEGYMPATESTLSRILKHARSLSY